MKLLVKILGIVFGLILLVTAGVAIFALTFNPNDYKDLIIQKTAEATGRTLTLEQDLSLTVFPTFGVVINKASLSNPATGFKAANMVSFDRAEIGVNVLPLLSKKIEISKIALDKAVINLEVNKAGKQNWVFETAETKPAPTETSAVPAGEDFSLDNLSIGELNIANAVLNYSDAQSGQNVSLDPFSVTMRNLRNAADIPTQASFIFKDGKGANIDTNVTSTVNANIDSQQYTLKGTDLTAVITSKDAQPITIKAKADATAALKQEKVALSNLDLTLNNIKLNGNAGIQNFAQPAVSFNLNTDTLDLTPFMEPSDTGNSGAKKASSKAETPIDLAFLKTLKFDGQLNANTIKADKTELTDFKGLIGGPYGTITLKDMTFKAFGGAFSGQGLVDGRNAVPAFSFKADVIKANMADVIKTYMGEEFITGLMDATLNINTQGRTDKALINNLTGSTNFNMGQGVVSKWELSKRLNQVLGFIKTGSLAQTSDDEFKFTAAKATTQISNGVIRNDDLNIEGIGLNFLGNGFVNVAQQTVDYTLNTELGEGLLEKSSVRSVPIRVSGKFDDLSYKVQMTEAVKQKVNETITEKANEYLESEKGQKLKDKIDKSLGEGATEQLKNILPF